MAKKIDVHIFTPSAEHMGQCAGCKREFMHKNHPHWFSQGVKKPNTCECGGPVGSRAHRYWNSERGRAVDLDGRKTTNARPDEAA